MRPAWASQVQVAQLALEVRRIVVAEDVARRAALRMPSIIEAWLPASDSTTQSGMHDASVPSAAQLET